MLRLLPLLLMLACNSRHEAAMEGAEPSEPGDVPAPVLEPEAPSADAPAPDVPVAEVPAAGPATGQAPAAAPVTPGELYASCRERVEGREADGECVTDADCKAAGCSGEVCVTAALAAEIMTTCEVRPCFEVLDSCGCHDGRCTWTLKDEAPGLPRLPVQIPQ